MEEIRGNMSNTPIFDSSKYTVARWAYTKMLLQPWKYKRMMPGIMYKKH